MILWVALAGGKYILDCERWISGGQKVDYGGLDKKGHNVLHFVVPRPLYSALSHWIKIGLCDQYSLQKWLYVTSKIRL